MAPALLAWLPDPMTLMLRSSVEKQCEQKIRRSPSMAALIDGRISAPPLWDCLQFVPLAQTPVRPLGRSLLKVIPHSRYFPKATPNRPRLLNGRFQSTAAFRRPFPTDREFSMAVFNRPQPSENEVLSFGHILAFVRGSGTNLREHHGSYFRLFGFFFLRRQLRWHIFAFVRHRRQFRGGKGAQPFEQTKKCAQNPKPPREFPEQTLIHAI